MRINSKEYTGFLKKNGYRWGELSAGKHFPDFIMQASDGTVILFIRTYMDAEAHLSEPRGVIQMCTASIEVVIQMFILLKRFEINSRILKKRKCATNGHRIYRDYYELHISGPSLRIYRDKISFSVDYKKDGLDRVCDNRKTNTNTEIIPMHKELNILRESTNVSKALITNKANFYGKTNPSVSEGHIILGRVNKLIDMSEDDVAWKLNGTKNYMTPERKKDMKIFRKFLKTELAKEVCYIPIKSIEKVDHEGYVYSLQVRRYNNFVADGMLCFNANTPD